MAEIKNKQKQTIQQEEKKRQTENNILLFVSSIRGTVSPYYICKWIFTVITFLMTCLFVYQITATLLLPAGAKGNIYVTTESYSRSVL